MNQPTTQSEKKKYQHQQYRSQLKEGVETQPLLQDRQQAEPQDGQAGSMDTQGAQSNPPRMFPVNVPPYQKSQGYGLGQSLTQHIPDGSKFLKEEGHEEQGHDLIDKGSPEIMTHFQDAIRKQQIVERGETEHKQVPVAHIEVICQIGIAIIHRFLPERKDISPQSVIRYHLEHFLVGQEITQQLFGSPQTSQIQRQHHRQGYQCLDRYLPLMTQEDRIGKNTENRTPKKQNRKQ